jgi:hypothetical protein
VPRLTLVFLQPSLTASLPRQPPDGLHHTDCPTMFAQLPLPLIGPPYLPSSAFSPTSSRYVVTFLMPQLTLTFLQLCTSLPCHLDNPRRPTPYSPPHCVRATCLRCQYRTTLSTKQGFLPTYPQYVITFLMPQLTLTFLQPKGRGNAIPLKTFVPEALCPSTSLPPCLDNL